MLFVLFFLALFVIFYESVFQNSKIYFLGEMYYYLAGLFIIIINFLQHFPYYCACFLYLSAKVNVNDLFFRSFGIKIGVLLDLIYSSKQHVRYLPTTQEKVHELIQHLWNVEQVALKGGLVYCPSSKKSKHDGCIVDLSTNKIIEIIQLKMKMPGSNLSREQILRWFEAYPDFDKVQVGFTRTEDFNLANGLIESMNSLALHSNLNVRFEGLDLTSFVNQPKSHFENLLKFQWDLNPQVTFVNDNMINKLAEIQYVDEKTIDEVFLNVIQNL